MKITKELIKEIDEEIQIKSTLETKNRLFNECKSFIKENEIRHYEVVEQNMDDIQVFQDFTIRICEILGWHKCEDQ